MALAKQLRQTAGFFLAMFAAASHATFATTPNGSETIYGENFDGATSFQIQYFNRLTTSRSFVSTGGSSAYSGDGYLQLANGILHDSGRATYTFSTAAASAATLDFLYGFNTNATTNWATVSIDGTSVNLLTYKGVTEYSHLNPGLNSTAHSSYIFTPAMQTFSLGAGQHTLQFAISGVRAGLKVDDLTMTVAPVPEPEIYGMMLVGLGLIGAITRRRKNAIAAY